MWKSLRSISIVGQTTGSWCPGTKSKGFPPVVVVGANLIDIKSLFFDVGRVCKSALVAVVGGATVQLWLLEARLFLKGVVGFQPHLFPTRWKRDLHVNFRAECFRIMLGLLKLVNFWRKFNLFENNIFLVPYKTRFPKHKSSCQLILNIHNGGRCWCPPQWQCHKSDIVKAEATREETTNILLRKSTEPWRHGIITVS